MAGGSDGNKENRKKKAAKEKAAPYTE